MLPKAKPHPDQLGFVFEAPESPKGVASLAGLERRISEMVATILNSEERSRKVLAAEVSELLDDEVSWQMLDAYASPARREHKVPMSRALALVAVTGRHDLLDPIVREIGAALLVGDEVLTARIGQIDRTMEKLKAERRKLVGTAPLIRSGGEDK